jgi:hypothetical protein
MKERKTRLNMEQVEQVIYFNNGLKLISITLTEANLRNNLRKQKSFGYSNLTINFNQFGRLFVKELSNTESHLNLIE